VTKPRFASVAAVLGALVLARAAPAQERQDQIEVLVVDKKDGRPVEGADVITSDAWPDGPWVLGGLPTTDEVMKVIAGSEVRSRTGRDGRARLARGAGEIALLAQAADARSAFEWVTRGVRGRVTLTLEAEETAEVAVLDEAGKPVGNVEVRIVIPRGGGWRVAWSGATAEGTGIASVRHWERVRNLALRETGPGTDSAEVVVTTALPLLDPPVVRLDPSRDRPRGSLSRCRRPLPSRSSWSTRTTSPSSRGPT
jgi:hypothetical protein